MQDWTPREHYTAEDLVEIIRILRDRDTGCPWDKVQTHASIRKNFLEETCEVLEAIDLDAVRMKGYGFQIEMKYTAWRLGVSIREVSSICMARTAGVSKMSSGIFGEAFWGVIKLRFRKIRPAVRL